MNSDETCIAFPGEYYVQDVQQGRCPEYHGQLRGAQPPQVKDPSLWAVWDGQPSLNGFKQRQDGRVFLHKDDDFVPYTPRRKETHENLHGLKRRCWWSPESPSGRRRAAISLSCEEDIHVTEEVYKRPMFTMPAYRYYRLPLPMEGAPLEEDFDAFVNILRERPSLSLGHNVSRPLPALLFSCQVGVGRTNLAMILGTLVMNRLKGDSQVEEAAASEPKPLFQVIQSLINKLPNGQQVMEEVGTVFPFQPVPSCLNQQAR
ncbi:paladin isoform X1 [Lates japonicus]|uniref:Paladin isoform X1 n=1 Tax=Lates japonicus TaxID=270547 RepID=A0AAD3NFC7_LATJO|nr:paladin isoform X1 [Lates japonicus]